MCRRAQIETRAPVHYCMTVSRATVIYGGYISPNMTISPIHAMATPGADDDDATSYSYNVTLYWCD